MTEITAPNAIAGGSAEAAPLRRASARSVAVAHACIFAAAVGLAVSQASEANWNYKELAVLVILAAVSDLTSTSLGSRFMNVSGSFLGMTLAAVLLGGTPAAIVGALTITISWLRFREAGQTFRQNLVMYTTFPLLSGLMFQHLATIEHVTRADPGYDHQPMYYVLVFAAFVVALAVNFLMVAVFYRAIHGVPILKRLAEFRPILAAELSSALLTLVAVFIVDSLGFGALLMLAIVLAVYQYLIGELLLSKRRGEELLVQAYSDPLTGLANRPRFNDEVDAAIAATNGTTAAFGVLLIDLDHFKDINDTLGHQYGDDFLRDLAPRLAQRIGAGGLVARFGGDEFAILPAVRTDNMAALTAIVEDVMACIREPVRFDDITLEVDASIGVARFPHDGEDAQTLLRRADIAMYSAKAERDGHRFYTHGQDRHSVSRLSMVGDFRRALEKDDEIIVHFHPIVDLGSGAVHGAEALVRWQHPELGLLQPAAFLEIVEQTGLIGAMTTCVLEKAIAECAAWHAAGRDLTMSVNLSVRNLHDPMLSSQVAQMLDRHRLPPGALKLEITESMILSDPQRALATVESLSEIGVRFAVDDFGTGHSSLANLRRLPVHELKIDRSFVTPMLNEESDGVIVRSTIELGHALGLKVIAEGVEDEITLARLEEIGCDRAQGHFFSKPIPPIEFMRWISRYESRYSAAA